MLAVLVLTFLCPACDLTNEQTFTETQNAISLLLNDSTAAGLALAAGETVREFYATNACKPVWTANQSFSEKANELLLILNTCDQYGLFPEDYPLTFLNSSAAQPLDAADAALVDVTLTDSYFLLAHQLQNGTLNKQTLGQFSFSDADTSLVRSLCRALEGESVLPQLRTHEPQHPCYDALKESLQKRLTALACDEGYPGVDDDILTLQLNLERWRWQCNPRPERHIHINIPSYTLYLVANDSVIFRSRVIVGEPEHPTPVLTSQITCLGVYPSGHIVDSPLEWERPMLPSEFPKLSTSTPAEIQLIMEEPCRAYLDERRSQEAFREKMRALTDGCIRIENANELVRLLLCDNDDGDQRALEKALAHRYKTEFKLRNPVPVFVTYCTFDCDSAWADVYGLDDELRIAVENPAFNLDDLGLTMSTSGAAAGQ